jgi:hypothetical protein
MNILADVQINIRISFSPIHMVTLCSSGLASISFRLSPLVVYLLLAARLKLSRGYGQRYGVCDPDRDKFVVPGAR